MEFALHLLVWRGNFCYRFCDGANWQSIKSGRLSTCTSGQTASLEYDAVLDRLKFCDGSDWYDVTQCPADWYDCNWRKRVKITVNASQIPSAQSDFPAYVDLNSLGATFFSSIKSDGSDIVVTSSNGLTKLSRELEYLDVGAQKGALWFKASSISNGAEFFIYYGNSNVSEVNDSATWNSSFIGVWHSSDDPSAPSATLKDSTDNNNGTFQGSMNTADRVDGKAGKALEYDGTDDYVVLSGDGGVLDLYGSSQNMTMCAWATFRQTGDFYSIVSKGDVQYHLKLNSSRKWELKIANQYFLGDTTYSSANHNQWFHVCGVRNGTTNHMWVNGVQQSGSASTGTFSNQSHAVWLGRDSQNTTRPTYPGIIDEVKFSNVARSGDWISTEYRNQNNFSSFFSVSAEQEP